MKTVAIKPVIRFEKFSRRQMQLLTWWCPESPYKDYNGIIADGSIRTGETVSMAISFIQWAMDAVPPRLWFLYSAPVR